MGHRLVRVMCMSCYIYHVSTVHISTSLCVGIGVVVSQCCCVMALSFIVFWRS